MTVQHISRSKLKHPKNRILDPQSTQKLGLSANNIDQQNRQLTNTINIKKPTYMMQLKIQALKSRAI